jgi:glycine cleavage system H protein
MRIYSTYPRWNWAASLDCFYCIQEGRMMDFPENLRYTGEHEWILLEKDTVTVGITDYAQEQLGDVVFVEMPAVGTSLKKNDAIGVVESVKAASDVYAPVSGAVVEINENLVEHPEYVNLSPYGDGWMVKMKVADSSEIAGLMDSDAYTDFVKKESD